MITKKQLNIFQVFAKSPFAEFTRKEIKQAAKEKSNNFLALAIKQFTAERLIKEKKVGKSSLFSLNLDNDTSYYNIALANNQRIDKLAIKSLNLIVEEVEKITRFYSLVVFGSYATNEQKKDSDLDVAVFIESGEKKKILEAAVNSASLKSLINLDVHIITKDEFLEMLTSDEENLGKQIAQKHLAFHNYQVFYGLILDGVKHGFKL